MTAKEAAQKMRANGATLSEIAKELAADGFKSSRTGKAFSNAGVAYLCQQGPRKKAATVLGARKRKEFETIIAAAPESQEKQMIMVMGSPAQLRAMLKDTL